MDDEPSHVEVYDEGALRDLERDFSRLQDECYLDHAGSTLYFGSQLEMISDDLRSSLYGNPQSCEWHDARYRGKRQDQTTSEEYGVIFTSGATQGLKVVAETFTFSGVDGQGQGQGCLVYTQDNHTSVLGMRDVARGGGGKVICLDHDRACDLLRPESVVQNCDLDVQSISLFAFPAQCNFSGLKYPLRWTADVQSGCLRCLIGDEGSNLYVLLDAAAFVPTNKLDLSVNKPDSVTLSFYKIFGYPTELGALLVKNSSANVLDKVYIL